MFCTNTRQLVFKLNNQYAHLTCVFYSTQDTILNEYIVCSQDSISIKTQESLCTLLYSLVPRLLVGLTLTLLSPAHQKPGYEANAACGFSSIQHSILGSKYPKTLQEAIFCQLCALQEEFFTIPWHYGSQ